MQIEVDGLRIPVWPAGAIVLVILAVILWRRKHSFSHLMCFAVFGIYLLFAIDKAFFPIAISGNYVDAMREIPFSPFMNLSPFNFNFNLSEMPELVLMQIFQNVLLTVPFGFGVSFIAPLRSKDFLWLVPAIGIGIEATQLIISLILRYPYRVIDINDVILNGLGVLVGYIIFRIFAWLYLWVTQRSSIKHGGLAAYIYAVVSQK